MSVAANHQPAAPPRAPQAFLLLDQITPSATNPRKSFDGPEFDELVASIQQHGILQPVLVRPMSAKLVSTSADPLEGYEYELVCGERRFRAAKAAGLAEIPATIRELSDTEAREIQIIENLQRKDVSALEEAEGFRQLLAALQVEQPKTPQRELVEAIGKKVGKSLRYVYARMQLSDLVPEVKKAIEEGKITASHGDMIVRLPQPLQKKALDECFDEEWVDGKKQNKPEPVSIREFKQRVSDQFTVNLDKTPFKLTDANLVPNAGACSACKKNLANDPMAESKKPLCQDPGCFKNKVASFIRLRMAEARGQYRDAIGKELKGEVLKLGGDYSCREKTDMAYWQWQHHECKPTACDAVKVGVVLNGDRTGETVFFCVDACKVHRPGEVKKAQAEKKEAEKKADPKAAEKAKQAAEQKHAADQAVVLAILAKTKAVDLDLLIETATQAEWGQCSSEMAEAVCVHFGWKDFDPNGADEGYFDEYGFFGELWTDHGKKLSAEQKAQFLTAMLLTDGYCLVGIEDAAAKLKLDVKAIRSKAVEQVKAKQKAEADKVQTPAVADPKASTKKPAKKSAKKSGKKGGR